MARRDRRKYINDITIGAEAAANNGDIRGIYTAIRQLSGRRIRSTPPLNDANGHPLTSEQDQCNRWVEHFADDTLTPESPPAVSNRRPRRTITTEPPTLEEIQKAIRDLKYQKSPGPDDIAPELLKFGALVLAAPLKSIIDKVWRDGKIPDSWKEGVIITIPKKGNLSECKNWRGITLLNTVIKLLAMLIRDRLMPTLDNLLRPEQAGFRPNRSCTDQVNTLRIIIEQSAEWRSSLYILFVDFERAFDTINRNAIWEALAELGVPDKIIQLIKELYRDAKCRVRFAGTESDTFSVNRGVRQGCVLSPLLFLVVLDSVLKKVNAEAPDGIQWTLTARLHDLDYADDLALLSHTFEGIKTKLQKLNEIAARVGLKINYRKTKIMRINSRTSTPLDVDGTTIEDVDEFEYLGCTVTKTGGTDADIDKRINKARHAYFTLGSLWRSSFMSRGLKLRIFSSCILSVLLYGCETWGVAARSINKLQVFVNKCLRRICKIFWPETISNSDLHELTNIKPILKEIGKRKWRWIGHTLRRPTDNIARQALDWNPQGSRRPGRPSNTWRRTIEREVIAAGKTWRQTKALAGDRERWRQFTNALCSL